MYPLSGCAGQAYASVAAPAQALLEQSLLGELRAVVARALSGLDMFAGSQLAEEASLSAESAGNVKVLPRSGLSETDRVLAVSCCVSCCRCSFG